MTNKKTRQGTMPNMTLVFEILRGLYENLKKVTYNIRQNTAVFGRR